MMPLIIAFCQVSQSFLYVRPKILRPFFSVNVQ